MSYIQKYFLVVSLVVLMFVGLFIIFKFFTPSPVFADEPVGTSVNVLEYFYIGDIGSHGSLYSFLDKENYCYLFSSPTGVSIDCNFGFPL